MSASDNAYEFLSEITATNILKVSADFRNKFSNYTTLYMVDTYDVIQFCFPLIYETDSLQIRSQLKKANFLSYQFFFLTPIIKPILPKEYKIELFSFWYRLEKQISKFSVYNNLKTSMIKQYKTCKDAEDKVAFVESNIGMLLALAYGALSKSPVDRYNKVINALQIDSIKVVDEEDERILEDIIFDTKFDIITVNKVFDGFCDESKFWLMDKSEASRNVYLENSYRDIKVFDLVTRINHQLEQGSCTKRLKNKYQIFYVSSAKKKMEIIEKEYAKVNIDTNAVNSIHRSNLEIYLYNLLDIGNSENEKEFTLNFLEKLRVISQTYQDNSEKIKSYQALFTSDHKQFNNNLIKNNADVDDIFLRYHLIKEHRSKIYHGINKFKETDDDSDLLAEFFGILDKASENENRSPLTKTEASLDFLNTLIDIKSDVITNISSLRRNLDELKIQFIPGKDFIRSRVQSFPVLIFYQKKNIKKIQTLFYELIKHGNDNIAAVKKLIETPTELLREFSTLERKLFFLFIRYLMDASLTPDVLINELDEALVLNEKSVMRHYKSSPEKVDISFNMTKAAIDLENDLIYFKSWVLRRDNQHNSSIDLICKEEEKAEGFLDARLYHSRALSYKNQYYNESTISTEHSVKVLTDALSDFHKCENLFQQLVENNDDSLILIPFILIAVSNSIIDTYTKLFLLNKDFYERDIEQCRIRLDTLKQKISKTGDRGINNIPAFGHTEVDLEYCEAIISYKRGDLYKSQTKIQAANRRLEKIIRDGELNDHGPFNKTITDVRELANFLLRIYPSRGNI